MVKLKETLRDLTVTKELMMILIYALITVYEFDTTFIIRVPILTWGIIYKA